MNLFKLMAMIGLDTKEYEDKVKKTTNDAKGFSSKLGGYFATGVKAVATATMATVTAAAGAVATITKSAIENYAEYEQLVGGVETLFKDSAGKVQEYAANAYKTAGMSANEYMSTVTSFSASLLQSLGGDTKAAANFADMAISDMSDNANKMGTDMESIQNAYQGFAKQNYTMLDNLKLGYGGTKEEMERLLRDAEKMGGLVEGAFDIDSFADVVEAINIVQTEMGITGTTALEAGRTISGSVGAMKSAWANLLTGLADGNADIGKLVDNLVTTIVGDGTENNLGVIGNVLPAVERALSGTGKLIEGAIPVLIERLPGLLQQILPVLLSSATSLANSVIAVLPSLVDLIVDALIDNAPMLIVAAVEMILALAGGLIEAIPKLLEAIPTIIEETVDALSNSETVKKFLEVGKNIVSRIWQGIKGAWEDLKAWFSKAWNDLVGNVKETLGIHSPSRVFAGIGKNMALGVGEGWEDEFGNIQHDIDKSLAFDYSSMRINASVRKMGAGAAGMSYGGNSFGDVYINVDGASYDDPQSLAVAVAQELQNMTDRRLAVYA